MVNREEVRHRLLTNIVRNDAPGAFPTSVFYSLVAYLFHFSKKNRVFWSIGSAGCLPPFLSSFRSTHTCAHETSFVYFGENGLTTVVFHLIRISDSIAAFVSLFFFFSIGPRCFAVNSKRKVVRFLNRFELVEHRRARYA